MRKFSSILPANSRLTTVDLTASPSRRPGSYNPYTGEIAKPSTQPLVAAAKEPIKVDKLTLSPEAKALKNDSITDAITNNHNKFKGHA